MYVVIAIWAGVSTFVIVNTITEDPEFDPWGEFTVQRVAHVGDVKIDAPDIPGVQHVFSMSNVTKIETSGMKCLNADQIEPITVGGAVYWYMVEPPGFLYQSGVFEGTSQMNPGCTSSNYVNSIPSEVVDELNLRLETEPYVIMNIQGYTVAYENGHEYGVRAPWTTENFAFVL